MSREFVLGVGVDCLTKEEWRRSAISLLESNKFHYAITVNALLVLDVLKSPFLKTICDEASLLVPDSSGFVWANSLLNKINLTRYPGIDLAFDLCQFAAENKMSVFLLGGKPGVAELAKDFLIKKIPHLNVAGYHNGFFSEATSPALVKKIRDSGAQLILVALGMPKQEYWIYQNRALLSSALAVGVGGTLDVWSGQVQRAPQIFQKWGLEWLYRLYQEPSRGNRIAQLPYFSFLVIREWVKKTTTYPLEK